MQSNAIDDPLVPSNLWFCRLFPPHGRTATGITSYFVKSDRSSSHGKGASQYRPFHFGPRTNIFSVSWLKFGYSLEIHAPKVDALARELASATGEDIDTAVVRAIEERLARTPRGAPPMR